MRVKRKGDFETDENNIIQKLPKINLESTAIAKMGIKIFIALLLCVTIFYYRDYLTVDNARIAIMELKNYIAPNKNGITSMEFAFIGDRRNQSVVYGNNLVVMGIDGIKIYVPSSSNIFHITQNFNKPVAKSGQKYLLGYEMGQSTLNVILGKEVVKSITTDGNIITADVNDAGYFLTVTSKSGYKGVVSVYNNALQEIYKWYSADNIIVDSAVSPISDNIAVLTLATIDGIMDSNIKTFSLNEEESTGEHSFVDDMAIDVAYKDANLIIALSGHKLYFLNGRANLKGEHDFKHAFLSKYDLTPQRYSVVSLKENKNTSKSKVVAIENNGATRGEYDVKEEILSLKASENSIYVLTQNKLILLNNKCELVKEYEIEDDVREIQVNRNGVYLIGKSWAKNMIIG